MKKILCLGALLFSGLLSASLQLEPGEFGILGEYLYLHPSFNDTAFVVEDPGGFAGGAFLPAGTRFNNNFNYRSGFRLEGGYAFCCPTDEVRIRWTHLNGHHNRTITSDLALFPTEGFPDINDGAYVGPVSSRVDFNFNCVEGFLQRDVYCCCPLTIALRAGLQYARIKTHENIDYANPEGGSGRALQPDPSESEMVKFSQKMWGIGPEVGIAADYSLTSWNCLSNFMCGGDLSLTSIASGGLLAGQLISRFVASDLVGDLVDTPNDRLWKVVPTFYIRMGVNYARCINWGCIKGATAVEIGYEFLTYCEGLAKIRYTTTDATSFDQYLSFNMHGPFAGLSFAF